MAGLTYPMYDLRTGRRLYSGPTTGAWGAGYTYGHPIFTGAEFLHVAGYFKAKGFHVYANLAFGGVNRTAHSSNSWHYVKDGNGRSLACDIGTFGDVNERARLINEVIPVLDRIGMGWHYARNGAVPGHYDHLHFDASNWGRRGGSAASSYGFYTTKKKLNPITALPYGSAPTAKKRKPKSCAAYYGVKGPLVKIIQKICGVAADSSYGPATVRGVKALQKKLKVTQDGNFGPMTARAYFASVGVQALSCRGRASSSARTRIRRKH